MMVIHNSLSRKRYLYLLPLIIWELSQYQHVLLHCGQRFKIAKFHVPPDLLLHLLETTIQTRNCV